MTNMSSLMVRRLARRLSAISPRARRTLAGTAVGLVIIVLMLLVVRDLPFFSSTERQVYDWQFQHRGAVSPPTDIVLVGLDDTSISDLNGGSYPIPRAFTAQVLLRPLG
jgi:CHASE2 domain-containing sensor protein